VAQTNYLASTRRLAVLSAALAFVAALAAAQPPAELSDDAARGRALYYAHGCYGCHGYNGETGVRNLVGTGSPIVENVDVFVAFLRLRADLLPVYPTTRMPNYAESALSDADARRIFAYIRTFELDAPEADQIPALRAILESAARATERSNR
jgi:mono/diheme cytochrome c family protein